MQERNIGIPHPLKTAVEKVMEPRERPPAAARLAMLALGVFTDALGVIASTGLWTMDRPGASIAGDVVQLVTTLAAAAWLVFSWGALGIAVATVVGRLAGAAVRWATLWALIGSRHCEPTAA